MPLIADLLITHLRNLSEQEEEPNPWLNSDFFNIHDDNSTDNVVIDDEDHAFFSYTTDENEDEEAILQFVERQAVESESESDYSPDLFYDPTHKSAGKLTVIKKGSSYIALINGYVRILDILLFMPQGCSYDGFLKAFKSKSKKWIFPFAQLTSYEALDGPIPPPGPAWWNELKNECSLDGQYQQWLRSGSKSAMPQTGQQKYREIMKTCQENNYKTLRHYLHGYNSSDVGPGVVALCTLLEQYSEHKVDVFMETCTVAGIARKILFNYAKKQNTQFPLIAPHDADLHYLIRGSITGGVSCIYTRKAIKGETYLTPEKLHKTNLIEIYDSNSLYLFCIRGSFFSKTYIRRHVTDNYKPRTQSRLIKQHVWLRNLMEQTGLPLKTAESNGMDISFGKYRVDAMHTDENGQITVYEFKGKQNFVITLLN